MEPLHFFPLPYFSRFLFSRYLFQDFYFQPSRMITVAKFHHTTTKSPPYQLGFCRSSDSIPPFSHRRKIFLQPCKSFRTDEGKDKGRSNKIKDFNKNIKICLQGVVKSLIFSKDSVDKLEENLARVIFLKLQSLDFYCLLLYKLTLWLKPNSYN